MIFSMNILLHMSTCFVYIVVCCEYVLKIRNTEVFCVVSVQATNYLPSSFEFISPSKMFYVEL